MEYIYATLTLNELDQELNQENITAVLEAAGADVIESRVKAIVAALEDVELEQLEFDAPVMQATTDGDALSTADVHEDIGYTDIDEEEDDQDPDAETAAESLDEDAADGEEASPDEQEDR